MERVGVLALIVCGAWLMEVHASPRSAAVAGVDQIHSETAVARQDAAPVRPTADLVPTASVDLR